MQPYSQPFFWVQMQASFFNGMQFWFNGLPEAGLQSRLNTGQMKYWYGGLPGTVLKSK